MTACGRCGAMPAEGASYCGRCGAPLVLASPGPQPGWAWSHEEPSQHELLVDIAALDVTRPDGVAVLRGVNVRVARGEIIALLGGSGAGKSTLLTCIEDPRRLREAGFKLTFASRSVGAQIGIVPQAGALFDHVSVGGNLQLAMRNAARATAGSQDAKSWLRRMHLPAEWATTGRRTTSLSGGEAQRVAVARTLAGGRDLLFLDEPSVGIDPYRVFVLAAILREQIRSQNAAAIVITHDLMFAAAIADRFWFMDRPSQAVVDLDVGLVSKEVRRAESDVRLCEQGLSREVIARLERDDVGSGGAEKYSILRALGRAGRFLFDPLGVPVEALVRTPAALGRARDFAEVVPVVLKQTLLRPALFFAIVSTLVGYSVLYIFHRSFAGGDLALRDEFVFTLVGARHIIALAPPLGGILFAATSANAVTAWLGGISLTKQADALRALGISERRYLWVPAWLGLVISALTLFALFTAGMVLGGTVYIAGTGVEQGTAFEFVTAQLLDPEPADLRLLGRAALLLGLYAVGISADAIAKGSSQKRTSESVTVAMVSSVMVSTLWIVLLELATLPLVFR